MIKMKGTQFTFYCDLHEENLEKVEIHKKKYGIIRAEQCEIEKNQLKILEDSKN